MSDTAGPLNIPALIARLQSRKPDQPVRLIETHISWVLIAGETAYKIKKPVKFAFVNFLDPADRHHFCQEELRLNRRLAPDIYLAVVPITLNRQTGDWSIDTLPGPLDEVMDWAVKMKAFRFSTLDLADQIAPQIIDGIADSIARFHGHEPPLPAEKLHGIEEEIGRTVLSNLKELEGQLPDDPTIAALTSWTQAALTRLAAFFAHRKAAGFIKECHGDLHLANIALDGDRPIIFDCIEFSESLRCIDVINEVAFLTMDLIAHH